MSERLVVEATGLGMRGALLRHDRLIDLLEVDALEAGVTDHLFLGQVQAVDQRLNAAFVDIGEGPPAFLNAKDARHGRGSAGREPITKLLHEGERLIVQGVREAETAAGALATKGPRVTADLKLYGFHLILRPHGRGAELAHKARGDERQRLLERGERLFPEAGVTLRGLAASVDDAVLCHEHRMLAERWAALAEEARRRERPGRLRGFERPLERLLRGVLSPALKVIEVGDEVAASGLQHLLRGPLAPHGIELIKLDPTSPAFAQTEVAEALELALGREVPLVGGGRLIVEPVTAFTAIDVDGGGRTALEVDLAAAAEVARLARLRNLGGSIVVDFVDLPAKAHQQRLDAALRKAFRDDPLPVDIFPMSPLGIVQISRAKRGLGLDARLRRSCPTCDGTGRIASCRARAEALLLCLRTRRVLPLRVHVAHDLKEFLETNGREVWMASAPATALTFDPQLPLGDFRIDG